MTEPKYVSDITFVYDIGGNWKAVYAGDRLLMSFDGDEEYDAFMILNRLGFNVKSIIYANDPLDVPPNLLSELQEV